MFLLLQWWSSTKQPLNILDEVLVVHLECLVSVTPWELVVDLVMEHHQVLVSQQLLLVSQVLNNKPCIFNSTPDLLFKTQSLFYWVSGLVAAVASLSSSQNHHQAQAGAFTCVQASLDLVHH